MQRSAPPVVVSPPVVIVSTPVVVDSPPVVVVPSPVVVVVSSPVVDVDEVSPPLPEVEVSEVLDDEVPSEVEELVAPSLSLVEADAEATPSSPLQAAALRVNRVAQRKWVKVRMLIISR
jgi:hypothetical protein